MLTQTLENFYSPKLLYFGDHLNLTLMIILYQRIVIVANKYFILQLVNLINSVHFNNF